LSIGERRNNAVTQTVHAFASRLKRGHKIDETVLARRCMTVCLRSGHQWVCAGIQSRIFSAAKAATGWVPSPTLMEQASSRVGVFHQFMSVIFARKPVDYLLIAIHVSL
jgi:hypothetical protein